MKQNIKEERVNLLKKVFDLLIESEGGIVLRKSENVLLSTLTDDIDLLLNNETNVKLWSLLKRHGFKRHYDRKLLNIYLYGAKSHTHYLSKDFDFHFDIILNASHKSLMSDKFLGYEITYWLPLHQEIQDAIWQTKELRSLQYFEVPVLSNLFEYIHILTHIILDKHGLVSDYYKDRLYTLVHQLDAKDIEIYLKHILFSFSQRAIEICKTGNIDSIYSEYIKFKDY